MPKKVEECDVWICTDDPKVWSVRLLRADGREALAKFVICETECILVGCPTGGKRPDKDDLDAMLCALKGKIEDEMIDLSIGMTVH